MELTIVFLYLFCIAIISIRIAIHDSRKQMLGCLFHHVLQVECQ